MRYDLTVNDLFPIEITEHRALSPITALPPEAVVGAILCRATGIIFVAIHSTKSRPLESTEPTRMRLALVEKPVTETVSTIRRKQHRLTEVKNVGKR